MFQELKISYYKQIEDSVQKYDNLENKINQMEEELKDLEQQLTILEANVPSRPIQITGIKSIFTSKKKKKENEEKRIEYRNYSSKKSKIINRISELKRNITEVTIEKKKINIEELKKQKEELDQMTVEQWIETILQSNPDLSENLDFIKEIVNINIEYIKYDRTNNRDLYIDVMKRIKENKNLIQKTEEKSKKEMLDDRINSVLEELENPKEVEEGKYKIPEKYLFEAIRMDIKIHSNFTKSDLYIVTDGKYSDEVGKMLESNYESEDYYFLIHRDFKADNSASFDEEESKLKSICKSGLKMSGHSETNSLNALASTTVGTCHLDVTFMDLISSNLPKVIMMIPKERIDNNVKIWGSNDDRASYDKPTHLLPEYVMGYTIDNNFYSNPYSLEEREQYKYFYGQYETIPQNNELSM